MEVQELETQAVVESVETDLAGLKANRDTILAEKKALQEKARQDALLLEREKQKREELERRLNEFESQINIDEYKAFKANIEKDEHAKLIAEGKFDEVINKRTELLKKDMESKLSAVIADRDAKAQQLEAERARINSILIDTQLQEKAAYAGVHSTAIRDVVNRGREYFSVDDMGNLVCRDPVDGSIKVSKDGHSNLSMSEWFDYMKDEAPHLFKASTGSGSVGTKPTASPGFPKTRTGLKEKGLHLEYISRFGQKAYLDLPS